MKTFMARCSTYAAQSRMESLLTLHNIGKQLQPLSVSKASMEKHSGFQGQSRAKPGMLPAIFKWARQQEPPLQER